MTATSCSAEPPDGTGTQGGRFRRRAAGTPGGSGGRILDNSNIFKSHFEKAKKGVNHGI